MKKENQIGNFLMSKELKVQVSDTIPKAFA